MKNKIQLDATHPPCHHLTSNQQQLENQTTYAVTNTIVVSS